MQQSHFEIRSALLGLALAVAVCLDAAGAAGLTAGTAKFEITPDTRLTNWITHKPYGEVLEPIFVRAVVMESFGKKVAFLNWELLYPMESGVAKVRKEISREIGIPAGDILVFATHNHSAPWSPMFGSDPLTTAEVKVLKSFLEDPLQPAWSEKVIQSSVAAVKQADASRRPASLSLGRAYAGDVIFNRRPMRSNGSVESMSIPADPYVLPRALRFGRVDPTLTVLALRDEGEKNLAMFFHLPCHAVMIYPSYQGISGDWPATASAVLEQRLGGTALFMQGCAGDVAPIRRGTEARQHLAGVVAERAAKSVQAAEQLRLTNAFHTASRVVQAPVEPSFRAELGRQHLSAEVQVITCGDLAIVALPGEPLNALAAAIQEQSPYSHTIVLGYSNGYGVQYVGMPGDKARGGYEMGTRNLGNDECGQLLVDAAVKLLKESGGK